MIHARARRASQRCAVAVFFAILTLPAAAGADVYLFWRVGCPHCEREIEFLEGRYAANPDVRLHKLEVSRNRANADAMVQMAGRLGVEAGSVPLTVIGDRAWVGYLDDATTGRELVARVAECLARGCPEPELAAPTPRRGPALPSLLRLPLVGEVHTANLSLFTLTVLLAAVDGFNPCAMWVLGIAFVAVSALVYLLILGAWLNVLLLAGTLAFVRVGIGIVALLYITVFMLDDLIVLVTALKTLEATGLTTRYARWSNAFGGVSLVAIGGLLIFRPEWLAFG